MGKDAVDQMIDELRQYKQGGGKIPPAMIDRIVGLLGQQKLRIEELTTISGNARGEIVGIVEVLGPKK